MTLTNFWVISRGFTCFNFKHKLNLLVDPKQTVQQILMDQQRDLGEKLFGRECVCVREDLKKSNYDASFWEGTIKGPEQDLGVTEPFIVHFRQVRLGTVYVLKQALFWSFART